MRYLLDTNALLWSLGDSPRFTPSIRATIRDSASEVFVSVAALLEIAVKVGAEKLDVDVREVAEHLLVQRYTLLAASVEHAVVLSRLPRYHRDPFDRLMIAQAMVEDATVVTADRLFPNYPIRVLAL